MQQALKTGSPFVFINDSGGARVQEGIDSLSGYGQVFYNNVMLSGAVPQVSLICGPCAGGAAYSPALTDFIIQTRQAQMFITGPQVIKQVTGENVTADQLGGPETHMISSGVTHFIAEDDRHAVLLCQKLLSFLPSNNLEDPPRLPGDMQRRSGPAAARRRPGRDQAGLRRARRHHARRRCRGLLRSPVRLCRQHRRGFARITGRSVGIIANQPLSQAGVLDINASNKASRFIRFCNAFNIPLVTFVDVPGFLPGVEQEYGGIIRHGAKMLFAYSAATVPKLTVILRKSYGGAYLAMCGKDLAPIACSGGRRPRSPSWAPKARRRSSSAGRSRQPQTRRRKRREMIASYRDAFSNPYVAAGRRLVDDVIDPADTRAQLAQTLEYLQTKRELRPAKKHGLMPL